MTRNKSTSSASQDRDAIDPLKISEHTRRIVIRVGGNSLTPRGQASLDYDAVAGLLSLVKYYIRGQNKVIVVPGGVAGHVLIEWARRVGSSDALINSIGSSLIDIGATILADYFARELSKIKIACTPIVASSVEQLLSLHASFPLTVCNSGIRGAISSDSIALLVADAVNAPVLSIKRAIPFQQQSSLADADTVDCTHLISQRIIEQMAVDDDFVGTAGRHHSVDVWAVHILRKPATSLLFTGVDDIKKFPRARVLKTVLKVKK